MRKRVVYIFSIFVCLSGCTNYPSLFLGKFHAVNRRHGTIEPTLLSGGDVDGEHHAIAEDDVFVYSAFKFLNYSAPDNLQKQLFPIIFKRGEYSVKNSDDLMAIAEIAAHISDNGGLHIFVVGYCNEERAEAYNLLISQKRADSVRKLLMKYGVSHDRISAFARGSSLDAGDCEDHACVNFQRVEFYLKSVGP